MLGLARKKTQPKVAPPRPNAKVIPFPGQQTGKPAAEEGRLERYTALAKELGYYPTELTRDHVLVFLEKHDILRYDYDEVHQWMRHKREEAGMELWCWRPLRDKDVIQKYIWGHDREHQRYEDGHYSHSQWQCRVYERRIPYHALEKVALLEKEFGDTIAFFVSDYAHPDADPFLMVRPRTCDSGPNRDYHIVIDFWDEPGFGETPKK